MKIYYWTPYMGHVGTIKATINSAIALKQNGHTVKIYRIHKEWEGYEEILKKYEIDIIDLGMAKVFPKLLHGRIGFRISMIFVSLYSYSKLKKNWESDRPDIIMAYLLGYLPIWVRKKSKHKPIIINSIQGKPMFNWFRKWLWNRLYVDSDQIIVLSEQTQKDLYQNLRYPKEKIVLLPNPIIDSNMDHMALEPLEEPYASENVPIILGVGRLTRQKNFETLIKAYNIVRKNYPCCLWILGEGEERERLQNLINKFQIQNHAKLIGFVSNPYKYMKKADVFVLSSLWEDSGHVLIEAAYMKMKIVSTRCPSGQEEFLDYGQRGELCDMQSPESMAQAIRHMLDHANESQNLAKTELAYKAALAYTLEQHGEKMEALLETVRRNTNGIDCL